MMTGARVYLDLLLPGLGLPHQQVGAGRLTERVVLTVKHKQGQRDGLQVGVNVLQTSGNTKSPDIFSYVRSLLNKVSFLKPYKETPF